MSRCRVRTDHPTEEEITRVMEQFGYDRVVAYHWLQGCLEMQKLPNDAPLGHIYYHEFLPEAGSCKPTEHDFQGSQQLFDAHGRVCGETQVCTKCGRTAFDVDLAGENDE
jgi:hypothetical protein